MRTPEDIVSHQQIVKVHGYANFGPRAPRDVVNEALLKVACGFSNGATANQILFDHGLIHLYNFNTGTLTTAKGRKYLWAVYGRDLP